MKEEKGLNILEMSTKREREEEEEEHVWQMSPRRSKEDSPSSVEGRDLIQSIQGWGIDEMAMISLAMSNICDGGQKLWESQVQGTRSEAQVLED